MDNREIDLAPHEWRSKLEKQREPFFGPRSPEPFFGPGAVEMLAWLIGFSATATAVYFVLH